MANTTKMELLKYIEEDRKYLADAQRNLPKTKKKAIFEFATSWVFIAVLGYFGGSKAWTGSVLHKLYLIVVSFVVSAFSIWKLKVRINGAEKAIELARETLEDSLRDAELPQEHFSVNGVKYGK